VVEVIAPWLVNPVTSSFYKFWNILVTIILQIELFCIPFVLITQGTLLKYAPLFRTLDFLWLGNMLIQLQTVRPENPSTNPIKVAAIYIKSEFLLDLVATVPAAILSKSHLVYPLRFLHIHEISKSRYLLSTTYTMLFPNSRINRINLHSIISFGYLALLIVHYMVFVWIWIGDKYLLNDNIFKPWKFRTSNLSNRLYATVFYYVVQIWTTAGYGDMLVGTTVEYLVS
jgi:hypothetical protein